VISQNLGILGYFTQKAFMSCVQKAKMTNEKNEADFKINHLNFVQIQRPKKKKSTSSNAQINFYNLLMIRINTYQYSII